VDRTSVQRYARVAGLLVVISILAGGFGEVYVPSKLLVPADAAATAKNISDSNLLFRMSFAVYLVEATCDIALALLFYILLEPVSKQTALLAAFFGLVSTATFGFAELFYFASSLFTSGNEYFAMLSPEQRNACTLISLSLYGVGGSIFMVFYGVATTLRGYLIFRSGYLPRFLGALLTLAGLGFIVKNFLFVLVPRYHSDVLLLPMFVAMISLAGWLLLRGVDLSRWGVSSAIRDENGN
jgi:hypothetical protein